MEGGVEVEVLCGGDELVGDEGAGDEGAGEEGAGGWLAGVGKVPSLATS